ncbi:ABC transporter substrate-binding protein [Bifidobacterium pseudolongum subsp. globosum]|nr:ABC transporter substrate-binding protein [Bifidobacterium pseudolongum subsp. globosum]PKV00541.1 ABC transporter substrate-binding protein [Bifidobacterium pseudolongum subsp. globosum]RYQ11405.1 ABC transporter substrate-binding protein [Bifidobacterium pseudolongum subsp. globosum]RYQ17852.1 ABC transporter substrate-binding protein [Bifidobacterium pseudolongum subsp. globosum]RYQ24214.1 ABC transporter substrate-binding protein [Bifidobacterium pseudolongum subsp. globosum]
MDALEKAAKAEGQLTLIACPDDWVNWGEVIKAFQTKYGIKVNSTNPEASSAEEIKAAKDLKGQTNAPDVFDLGQAVAISSTDYFAPYKVSAWDKIPESNKQADGLYVNDYTGVVSIGYDSSKVPEPKSLNDLLDAEYKGKVAINGDPTQAGAAFAAVAWATLQEGGTLDDFTPGIDFFAKLKKAGNFIPVDATSATIASGETPVVIDWNYLNVAAAKQNANYKTVVLPQNAYGAYYSQAINKDAPHPASARLWEEFIYTPEAQNLFLKAGALPVMAKAMTDDGTIDKAALEAAGGLPSDIKLATQKEIDKANTLLSERWSTIASS